MNTTPQDEQSCEAPDVANLKRLADEIAPYVNGGPIDDLIERYKKSEGLKLKEYPKKGSGAFVILMQGLEAGPAPSAAKALVLWGNAARRQILKAA